MNETVNSKQNEKKNNNQRNTKNIFFKQKRL